MKLLQMIFHSHRNKKNLILHKTPAHIADEKSTGFPKWLLFAAIFAGQTMLFATDFKLDWSQSSGQGDAVILIHGLRGRPRSFTKMKQALVESGYEVAIADYPSTRYPIETLADSLMDKIITECRLRRKPHIHLVAHSLGCIMVRYYLQNQLPSELGSVIFLAPPHQGTELIDRLAWCGIVRRFNGPSGMQLGVVENNLIQSLQQPAFPFWVIMSRYSINPIASLLIPGKDDGRVSRRRAHLGGEQDFFMVNCHHHNIMKDYQTIALVRGIIKEDDSAADSSLNQ
ncbi:MAG: alpha/beta fold hydrolase [Calditrichaeota bacterium]|nr:MAG: alpha/beta fold hydrolase [Calditrichota bacterium]